MKLEEALKMCKEKSPEIQQHWQSILGIVNDLTDQTGLKHIRIETRDDEITFEDGRIYHSGSIMLTSNMRLLEK